MNETINLDKLVQAVENSIEDTQKKKLENFKQRVERLQSYSTVHEVFNLGRIPVLPTTVTTTYETEQKKTWKCGKSKTIDCGTEVVQHEVKNVIVTDENIIEAIQAIHPQHVESKLYWFDNGKYLFTTDKGVIYSFRSTPRQLTKEEQEEIANTISDIESSKNSVLPMLRKAQVLQAYITPIEKRTETQLEMANSGECMMYLLELQKEFTRANKSSLFNNGINIYGESVEQYVIGGIIRQAIKAKEEHIKSVEAAILQLELLHARCAEEPLYFIRPLKENKQVKIYIGKKYKQRYANLGYKVYEQSKEEVSSRFIEEQGLIKEEERNSERTAYCIQMTKKTFVSSCIHGKVCRMGYYFDEAGNEVPLPKKPTQAVTVKDEKGNVYNFTSKTEAAKHFNLTKQVFSNILSKTKQGELPTISKKQQYNKKSIKLLNSDNVEMQFSSLTDVAKEFDTNKMYICRKLKNKAVGDVVTINGNMYTILEH